MDYNLKDLKLFINGEECKYNSIPVEKNLKVFEKKKVEIKILKHLDTYESYKNMGQVGAKCKLNDIDYNIVGIQEDEQSLTWCLEEG